MKTENKTLEERFREQFHDNQVDGFVDNTTDEILSFIHSERSLWEQELKIGDLRQWLNEKPKDRLITDEDIRTMLGLSTSNRTKLS